MKVFKRGEGDPEFTIIGSMHGDEPAGKKATEKVLEKDYSYQKPVKFIIANEEALKKDKRYLDSDLNRVFPGDKDSKNREEKLAAQIIEEVGDSKVLDIHTTYSFERPFASTKSFEDPEMEMIKASGSEYAVKFDEEGGTLTDFVPGIVVETGLQKSDQAVQNAVDVIENFLAYFSIIDADFQASNPELFIHEEEIEGDWEFLKENFQEVGEGEVFAQMGDQKLVAEESFYPVLMSTNGYEGILGHKASKLDE